MKPHLISGVTDSSFGSQCPVPLSCRILFPYKNPILRTVILPVNVPKINTSHRPVPFCFTQNELNHFPGSHLRFHPLYVALYGKRLLENKIFPYPIRIPPSNDPFRIIHCNRPQIHRPQIYFFFHIRKSPLSEASIPPAHSLLFRPVSAPP